MKDITITVKVNFDFSGSTDMAASLLGVKNAEGQNGNLTFDFEEQETYLTFDFNVEDDVATTCEECKYEAKSLISKDAIKKEIRDNAMVNEIDISINNIEVDEVYVD